MVKDSKDGGFKKRDLILLLIVVGIVTGIVYYLNRTPSVRVVEKASPWSNVGRYENSEVGFSVEYDADLLTKEFPQTRPGFVYTRATEQGQASMGVFVGFYPEGKTFESIVPSTMRSIKSTNPGSKING
ncbi:MAG: hypothetical protein GY866_17970, partial [Proteobacteria bacterium]|nr:hypothetical protein [Pseudomonadota bacterium]